MLIRHQLARFLFLDQADRTRWRVLPLTFDYSAVLLPCRDSHNNDLTELPPGIFDSLSLLDFLYVLSSFSVGAKASIARS